MPESLHKPGQECRRYWAAWTALLVLLGATCALNFIHLGALNTMLSLAIAFAKMLLIMLIFMRLPAEAPLLRFVAFAGFIWIAILMTFTITEYLTRT